jgi:hypothetical protein
MEDMKQFLSSKRIRSKISWGAHRQFIVFKCVEKDSVVLMTHASLRGELMGWPITLPAGFPIKACFLEAS